MRLSYQQYVEQSYGSFRKWLEIIFRGEVDRLPVDCIHRIMPFYNYLICYKSIYNCKINNDVVSVVVTIVDDGFVVAVVVTFALNLELSKIDYVFILIDNNFSVIFLPDRSSVDAFF